MGFTIIGEEGGFWGLRERNMVAKTEISKLVEAT